MTVLELPQVRRMDMLRRLSLIPAALLLGVLIGILYRLI